jgi:death on curing protein
MTFDFLSTEDALQVHAQQLSRFGGAEGLRDKSLLESALAEPQASFGGKYLYGTVYEMAAAYLFHIVSNHPFIDGNKRGGLLCALTFLEINGIEVDDPNGSLYDLTYGVAEGKIEKAKIAKHLEALSKLSK